MEQTPKYMKEWLWVKIQKGDDIPVNVCKKKHLTNMRSSASDEALRLAPPKIMSIEDCIEFLDNDEERQRVYTKDYFKQ